MVFRAVSSYCTTEPSAKFEMDKPEFFRKLPDRDFRCRELMRTNGLAVLPFHPTCGRTQINFRSLYHWQPNVYGSGLSGVTVLSCQTQSLAFVPVGAVPVEICSNNTLQTPRL